VDTIPVRKKIGNASGIASISVMLKFCCRYNKPVQDNQSVSAIVKHNIPSVSSQIPTNVGPKLRLGQIFVFWRHLNKY